jgi:hypothetical protein
MCRKLFWRHVGERVECVVHRDAPEEGGGEGGRKVMGVGVRGRGGRWV